MQYLYNQDKVFYFMDVETYEQSSLNEDQAGEAKNFLIDNLQVEILLFDKGPIGITLPNFVDLTVTRADPWVKGDSVSGDSKPVTVETGYVLRVPPFIEEGTKITVDTRTGEYVTRVK
jgi:elongation factor P